MLTFILIGGLIWLTGALLFLVALVLAARRNVPSVTQTDIAELSVPEVVSPSVSLPSADCSDAQGILPFQEQPAGT